MGWAYFQGGLLSEWMVVIVKRHTIYSMYCTVHIYNNTVMYLYMYIRIWVSECAIVLIWGVSVEWPK